VTTGIRNREEEESFYLSWRKRVEKSGTLKTILRALFSLSVHFLWAKIC
jgi:hypothetical protein